MENCFGIYKKYWRKELTEGATSSRGAPSPRCALAELVGGSTLHLLQRNNFSGVVEWKTQLLKLINILWLPLCESINLGGILHSKTVAIRFTCGPSKWCSYFIGINGRLSIPNVHLANKILHTWDMSLMHRVFQLTQQDQNHWAMANSQ